MRIFFAAILVWGLQIQSQCQDRLKSAGKAYVVSIQDFKDGKFLFTMVGDSSNSLKKIPIAAVEAWYSKNTALVERIRATEKDVFKKMVSPSESSSWAIEEFNPGSRSGNTPIQPAEQRLLGILPLINGNVEYQKIFEVPGVDKGELVHRAMLWLAEIYRSAPDVIKYSNPEKGTIIGKGIIKAYMEAGFLVDGFEANVNHKILIKVKDGKVLVNISDFVAEGYNPSTKYGPGFSWSNRLEYWASLKTGERMKKYLRSIDQDVTSSIDALEAYLKTDPNNW